MANYICEISLKYYDENHNEIKITSCNNNICEAIKLLVHNDNDGTFNRSIIDEFVSDLEKIDLEDIKKSIGSETKGAIFNG